MDSRSLHPADGKILQIAIVCNLRIMPLVRRLLKSGRLAQRMIAARPTRSPGAEETPSVPVGGASLIFAQQRFQVVWEFLLQQFGNATSQPLEFRQQPLSQFGEAAAMGVASADLRFDQ